VLHGGEVGLLGIMHVEADLLDGVDDVGALLKLVGSEQEART
jgi:hypothetical protein